MIRAVFYARFSSDLQSAASIEEQFRLCPEYTKRESWQEVARCEDHGISGASMLRQGLQDLLSNAQDRA